MKVWKEISDKSKGYIDINPYRIIKENDKYRMSYNYNSIEKEILTYKKDGRWYYIEDCQPLVQQKLGDFDSKIMEEFTRKEKLSKLLS